MSDFLNSIQFDSNGLVPAVIQDAVSKEVLMVGYMNKDALLRTIDSGKVTFWSRSRQKYWVKGESSGHTQQVKSISFDCDMDCVLVQAEQVGGACHKGYRTCFYRQLNQKGVLEISQERVFDPDKVY